MTGNSDPLQHYWQLGLVRREISAILAVARRYNSCCGCERANHELCCTPHRRRRILPNGLLLVPHVLWCSDQKTRLCHYCRPAWRLRVTPHCLCDKHCTIHGDMVCKMHFATLVSAPVGALQRHNLDPPKSRCDVASYGDGSQVRTGKKET
jgi:hypothetical protein